MCWAGKRVVVIDDSIVRGTTSRKLVAALRDAGATEVHMRISSPPVTHPCFYGIDTDTQDQLIAARFTLEEITAHLGVDSLAYLSKEGMVEAAHAHPVTSARPASMVPIRSRWMSRCATAS
jgi:amidophosphoribosyltransferase